MGKPFGVVRALWCGVATTDNSHRMQARQMQLSLRKQYQRRIINVSE
jgi:hypothetical protein